MANCGCCGSDKWKVSVETEHYLDLKSCVIAAIRIPTIRVSCAHCGKKAPKAAMQLLSPFIAEIESAKLAVG
jgi:hypothetical protein